MFETMIAREDLPEYIQSLDGFIDVSIGFNDDSRVAMTINQARQQHTARCVSPSALVAHP